MAKIRKSEVLGLEHPIYGGGWTFSFHRKHKSEEEVKFVEFMNKKYTSLIAVNLRSGLTWKS